jgi:hypothetical protein
MGKKWIVVGVVIVVAYFAWRALKGGLVAGG